MNFKKSSKAKTYCAFASFQMWYGAIGYPVIFGYISVFMTCHFYSRFIADGDFVWIFLIAMLDIPFLIFLYIFYFTKQHAFDRAFLFYRFESDGIYCNGLCFRRFFIPWDKIRTYGYIDRSYMFYCNEMIFFSLDKNELGTANPMLISYQRIIMQHNPKIWAAACEYMPEDMKKRLDESLRCRRNGFFKR